MSVINGQLANQTTFNNAFMSRTAATTSTVAKVALANTDLESGAQVVNTQRAINKIYEGVGISGEADTNVNNYASENYIADGDSRKVAIEKLDTQLKATQDDLDDHKTNVNAHPQYLTGPEADLLYDTLGSAATVQSNLNTHVGDTSNPHSVTKTQVGLSDVTNDAQLKRAAGDFNSFTEKTAGVSDDIVLIEDSADSFNKKKMKLSQVLGGGSGSGKINFLTNPDGLTGTAGWTEGSFAAASRPSGTFTASSGAGAFAISSTSTTPLGVGTTSLLLTKSSGASRQGRAVVSDFVLPIDYRAKVLSIDINYIINSGTFVAGSNSADSSLIWYCAFSNDNGATYTVAEPSSFKLLSNSTTISDRFRASIQTPYDATNMRLIAYVAETANSAWVVECIASVCPSEYVFGTPITDWRSYTPTLSWVAGITSNTAKWRRVGDTLEVQGKIVTSGAVTSAALTSSLPSGLSIDTTKLEYYGGAANLGQASFLDTGTANYTGVVLHSNNTSIQIAVNNSSATYSVENVVTQAIPFAWGATDSLAYSYRVPILGWSSSVQMSDSADTRVVGLTARKTAAQSIPTGTGTTITDWPAGYTDTHGSFDPTTGLYTVRTAGRYRAYGMLAWNGVSGGFRVASLLRANNTVLNENFLAASGTIPYNQEVSWEGDLLAGEAIKLVAFQNSGSALNIQNTTTSAGSARLHVSSVSGPQAIAATETIACSYTCTSGQSIPSGSSTIIIYNNKIDDSHGAFNSSTGVFTAPASGRYCVSASALYAGTAWTQGQDLEMLILAPSQQQNSFYRVPATYSAPIQLSVVSEDIYLTAGQTISIRLIQTTGSAKTLDIGGAFNKLTIARIGL